MLRSLVGSEMCIRDRYETLQFPLLFLHGESGWSEGHSKETPPYKSKTRNRANDSHVPFPFYCRQRILSESVFKTNSRIAQECACDSMSRLEEDLSFTENSPLQQILATDCSIRNSSHGENLGKTLPVSHHGPSAKCKSDTEDALAIVNQKGRPCLLYTSPSPRDS